MDRTALQLLVVEDNLPDVVLLEEALDEINERARAESWIFFREHRLEVGAAATLSEALGRIGEQPWDLVLCDLSLPDSTDEETVRALHTAAPRTPIVVLSGHDRVSATLKAAEYGAQDYLVKGRFGVDQLARTIRYAVERQRTLDQLEDALKAKSRFLANMSHELRTPLTAVVGYASSIQHGLVPAPEISAAAAAITRSADHLLTLIDEVLDLAKLDAGRLAVRPEPWRLAEIMTHVETMVACRAKERGLELVVRTDPDVPDFSVIDPRRTKQILLNIATNAVKFTERGSVEIRLAADLGRGELVWRVRDTGIGIATDQQTKLFVPFAQADSAIARQFGGTGLGLALSRDLARRMGGEVELESEPGHGTTVTVTLPHVRADEEQIRRAAGESAPRTGDLTPPVLRGRVLLAEDAPETRELLCWLLERAGLDVASAGDGAEALGKISAPGAFDLVLLDMHLPGLSGSDAAREIRKVDGSVPIVALTADAQPAIRRDAREAGCTDFLMKPFQPEALYELLARRLRGGAPRAEHRSAKRAELAARFRAALSERAMELCDALAHGDLDGLRDKAHKLLNAQLFGFDEVTLFAREIEHAALEGRRAEAGLAVARLREHVGTLDSISPKQTTFMEETNNENT